MLKSISRKLRKKFAWVLLLVGILVLIGLFLENNRRIEVKFDERGVPLMPEKVWYESQLHYWKRVVEWQEELKELVIQDDFGGATPEETFNGFVEALKVGNIELASRYFVFNDQGNELKKMSGLNEEQLLNYINFLEGESDVSCNKDLGWCEFHILYQNTNVLAAKIKYVESSGKWKMESL